MRIERKIADRGVMITLIPKSAQVHFQEAIDAPLTRTISMCLDLDPEEDIQLPDGKSLKMLSWTMTLIEGSIYNDLATKEGAIGLVFHIKKSVDIINDYSPESFHVGSLFKPEKFSTLLGVIQNGCLPDKIHITVRGLRYGGCPDGSLKVWDIVTNTDVFLIEMQFNIPLIATGETFADSSGELIKDGKFPATSGDIRAMERKLTEELVKLRSESQKRWIGLVGLLLVAIAALYTRS